MDENRTNIAESFKRALNQHGYGFQYTVLKTASNLSNKKDFQWLFEVSEFPVNVHGADTRIDFILRHIKRHIYLIAECKRANPALSNWCFARAPFVHKEQKELSTLILERILLKEYDHVSSETYQFDHVRSAYHIALEIKSTEKGDPYSKGRGAIEDAATQVCRGLNGLIEYVSRNGKILRESKYIDLLPVIFTTAKIWVSDVDLSDADLRTGNITFTNTNFSSKNWVWYQYHLSPGLKHSLKSPKSSSEFSETLDLIYGRTIAIVSESGIDNFLYDFSEKVESFR